VNGRIVCTCFDGDVDKAFAGVHDLYFGMQTVPDIWIDGGPSDGSAWVHPERNGGFRGEPGSETC
jgi:hypothetical protein